MSGPAASFKAPTRLERLVNRVFGWLLAVGIGLPHNYLLQVRGRKTGRRTATPVNVLELHGRRWLVAGRGRTQWVRNAEVAGTVVLRKGWRRRPFRLRLVANPDKPEILGAYLSRFRFTVQRYFPVRAGAVRAEFVPFVDRYPVFELLALDPEPEPRRGVLRPLLIVALISLLPSGWLASRPSFVHRHALDPGEPVYRSSYLRARGWPEPWLVSEVPPELAPVPWSRRVQPLSLVELYLLGAMPITVLWLAGRGTRMAVRWLGRARHGGGEPSARPRSR
jgi:hypothetical protein